MSDPQALKDLAQFVLDTEARFVEGARSEADVLEAWQVFRDSLEVHLGPDHSRTEMLISLESSLLQQSVIMWEWKFVILMGADSLGEVTPLLEAEGSEPWPLVTYWVGGWDRHIYDTAPWIESLRARILECEQEAATLPRLERKDLEIAWLVYADALEEGGFEDRAAWARGQAWYTSRGQYSRIARLVAFDALFGSGNVPDFPTALRHPLSYPI